MSKRNKERRAKLKDHRQKLNAASKQLLGLFNKICEAAGCTKLEEFLYTIRVLSGDGKRPWDETKMVEMASDRFPEHAATLRSKGTDPFLTSAWEKIRDCESEDPDVKEYVTAMRQISHKHSYIFTGQHRVFTRKPEEN
jgi:hypothetical protein